jgi:hypothetical protein
MARQLTYYDILGVLPGGSADEIQRSYDAKMAVLAPGMIAGASTKVLVAVDRARAVLEEARQTLTDREARLRYDTEVGILRPGSGLVRPDPVPSRGGWEPGWGWVVGGQTSTIAAVLALAADALAPRRRLARRVVVPDAHGLFVTPARRLMTLCGLHAEVVQLTEHPMPVEGVVVEQSPRAGEVVRRSGTVTVRIWHPAQQHQRRA